MKCKIIIQDVKISGNNKIIHAKCVRNNKIDILEVRVVKSSDEHDIKNAIIKKLKAEETKSIIGKTYNIEI